MSTYDLMINRRRKLAKNRRPILSNQVLGVVVFTATELMFFTALMSAYIVIKAGAGNWVPPEGVRLPVLATAFNTGMLMLSGLFILAGEWTFRRNGKFDRKWLGLAIILGSLFVVFQGVEWVRLISYGMTLVSDIFGATFFLLIGTHAVHAVAGIIALVYVWRLAEKPDFEIASFRAGALFWFFIVAVWPFLYTMVYFP